MLDDLVVSLLVFMSKEERVPLNTVSTASCSSSSSYPGKVSAVRGPTSSPLTTLVRGWSMIVKPIAMLCTQFDGTKNSELNMASIAGSTLYHGPDLVKRQEM